jgi:hypothetical protein
MNDTGFFECAQALETVVQRGGIESAFRRCVSRMPQPEELALLQRLDSINVARTLLNLDETVTRE